MQRTERCIRCISAMLTYFVSNHQHAGHLTDPGLRGRRLVGIIAQNHPSAPDSPMLKAGLGFYSSPGQHNVRNCRLYASKCIVHVSELDGATTAGAHHMGSSSWVAIENPDTATFPAKPSPPILPVPRSICQRHQWH
jgi:hypothetical protein